MEHRGQKRLHELEEERQKLFEAQRLQLVALLGAEQVCSHNTIVCSHGTIIVCSHNTIVCSHGTGAARRRAGLQPRSAATRTRGGRRVCASSHSHSSDSPPPRSDPGRKGVTLRASPYKSMALIASP